MGLYRFIGVPALTAAGLDAIKDGVTESADDLVEKAQERAHVRTGAERGGIHRDDVSVSGFGVTARVSSSMYYDIFQHEGTSSIPPNKFIEGPLLENAGAYRDNIRKAAKARF